MECKKIPGLYFIGEASLRKNMCMASWHVLILLQMGRHLFELHGQDAHDPMIPISHKQAEEINIHLILPNWTLHSQTSWWLLTGCERFQSDSRKFRVIWVICLLLLGSWCDRLVGRRAVRHFCKGYGCSSSEYRNHLQNQSLSNQSLSWLSQAIWFGRLQPLSGYNFQWAWASGFAAGNACLGEADVSVVQLGPKIQERWDLIMEGTVNYWRVLMSIMSIHIALCTGKHTMGSWYAR